MQPALVLCRFGLGSVSWAFEAERLEAEPLAEIPVGCERLGAPGPLRAAVVAIAN